MYTREDECIMKLQDFWQSQRRFFICISPGSREDETELCSLIRL